MFILGRFYFILTMPDSCQSYTSFVGVEPIVKSSVDKFYKTDLEKILHEKKIKTVNIIGTTAEGAVLHTATAAAMRGFRVVIPIGGMSAGTLYAEQ
jgi:nicotinamidase-related amidase